MMHTRTVFSHYDQFFVASLKGRYITLEHLNELFSLVRNDFDISIVGRSENGIEIPMIRVGTGEKKVLAWSQMHGNESTTTKAVMDFISFCSQKEHFQESISKFLNTYSFYVIPILNPDGALLYTRANQNEIDLNRDAKLKSQSESKALVDVFNNIKPDLCLNLHDQRTIYGASTRMPATISFLAPSADQARTITSSRQIAMKHIERMTSCLHQHIPGQVGRYDDGFNDNCVGEAFQIMRVPTILFEAGHYPKDYEREETRKFIFLALLELFEIESSTVSQSKTLNYAAIPENNKDCRDVILHKVRCPDSGTMISIALQYEEVLQNGSVQFQAVISEIGDLDSFSGHLEIDVKGDSILIDSQQIFEIGQNVTTVFGESDPSVVYFSMK